MKKTKGSHQGVDKKDNKYHDDDNVLAAKKKKEPKKKSKGKEKKGKEKKSKEEKEKKKEKEDSKDLLSLRVMTYNIWGGGGNEGKSINETVTVIQTVQADIVGVQETRLEGETCDADNCPPIGESVAAAIAESLGFHYFDQATNNSALWANAVISRYPILHATKNDLGVAIDVQGQIVFAYNIHLTDFPYQPYQLLNITYGPAPFLSTEDEAIAAAQAARGPALTLLFDDLKEADEVGKDTVAFIFGDFNEPSGLDWTTDAAKAGLHPLKVNFPTTRALEDVGFVDALRAVYPNPVEKPAFTWTPTTNSTDKEDHHDRIDFVFARGVKAITDAAVVGEKAPEADVIVTPWPSDHRAVVVTVQLRCV